MTSYAPIGIICGSIFQIILCVGVISGCVSLCCWCHKKCHKRRREQQRQYCHTIGPVTTGLDPNSSVGAGQDGLRVVSVVYIPASAPLAGYPPPYPNYQPVPLSPPNGGLSIPTAPPPSYQEATDPGYFPLSAAQRTQMYPIPLQPDQNTQQPFDPEYAPPKYDHT